MPVHLASLSIHRRGTDDFIEADPTDIALIPHSAVWSGGSKTYVAQAPRQMQTFKVIWDGQTGVVDEHTRRFDFILVGRFDATVAIKDQWQDTDGQKYVVEYVYPYNGYEVKCGGSSHGTNPKS